MKILLKVVGAIVACVILVLVILSITGLDPNQSPRHSRPGLWLKGEAAAFPADWTFAAKYQRLMVETHPWYLIPHSVTIYFVTDKGNLYLHADYPPGRIFPSGKSWTAAITRDPQVRIKIGNQVFDGKVALVTDPAEFNTLFEAFRTKYPRSPFSKYSRRKDVFFLRVLPG